MALSINQELLKKKTPKRECPSSSEKLRKKLSCQSFQIRKQRRDNLFNKQRQNLSKSNSSDKILAERSENLGQQSINLRQLTSSDESTNLQPNQIELNEQLELFYMNLKSKYALFKQSSDACDLINYLCKDNRLILNICTKEFRSLIYEQLNKQVIKFLNMEKNENRDKNPVLINYQNSVYSIIKLINEIVIDLIGICFSIFDLRLLEQFSEFILYLNFESITILDEERFVFNLIDYCSNSRLELNKIPIYINLFRTICAFIDGIDDQNKLWIYVTGDSFLNQLKLHTSFLIQLIDEIDKKPNENSKENRIVIDPIVSKDLIDLYLELLFKCSYILSVELVFEILDVQNDLYQLVCNLKKLANLKSSNQIMIYYIQILNNFFEPVLNYEFLIPVRFVEECCTVIKLNGSKYNSSKKNRIIDNSTTLIEVIISFFSNITCLEMYCELLLINNKIISCLQNLFVENKENLNLVYDILIIIKNITSIEVYNEDAKITNFKIYNSFELIFTPKFVPEFINSFDLMNGKCQSELSTILNNIFEYAKPNVIKLFINLKFIKSLSNLLNFKDQTTTYLVLKILTKLIDEKSLNSYQLICTVNCFESVGILDLVEELNFNRNEQISKLASNVLDRYCEICRLKENISP